MPSTGHLGEGLLESKVFAVGLRSCKNIAEVFSQPFRWTALYSIWFATIGFEWLCVPVTSLWLYLWLLLIRQGALPRTLSKNNQKTILKKATQ